MLMKAHGMSRQCPVLVVLLLLTSSVLECASVPRERRLPAGDRTHAKTQSQGSVGKAVQALSSVLDKDRDNRLAVSILHTHPWNNTHETRLLLCSLALLQKNIMQSTPTDVFIFYRHKPSEGKTRPGSSGGRNVA
jgi:hypothetical protein